jgi:serine/threonine protein kinase
VSETAAAQTAARDAAPSRYLNVNGQPVSCAFTADPDDEAVPGSPFRERELHRAPGSTAAATPSRLLQRRLVEPSAPDKWPVYDLMDNEIRIGIHLARTFGDDSYPDELSRLIGYDVDADEPFVLLLPYRGDPVDRVAGRLKLDQERAFEAGVFRALRLLEAAQVVHGRISPATVRWDAPASTIQLVDFGRATMAGEPRPGTGLRPWSAAEQVTGVGRAETGDDIWSAGLLTYHVSTGRPIRTPGEPPDLTVRGTALATLLDGVFAAKTADRPSAAQLLSRLHVPDPWAAGTSSTDARFAEGGREFDKQLRLKFPPPPKSNPQPQPKRGRKGRGRRWPLWTTGLILVVFALAAVFILTRIR